MAKRRSISYAATARLAVIGGAVSVLAVLGVWAMPDSPPEMSTLADVLSVLGVVAWFLGAASGVLSLSTPYIRVGVAGLVLCGISAIAVIAVRIAGA